MFQVPKFSYDSQFDLADALQSLGVRAAFGDPVSYTHLDVYKRQTLLLSRCAALCKRL